MASITLTAGSLNDNKPALQSSVAPAAASNDDIYMARKVADNDSFKSSIDGRISGFSTAHGNALTALGVDFAETRGELGSSHDSAVTAHGTRKSGFDSDLAAEISAEGSEYSSYNTALAADLTAMKAKMTSVKAGSASLQVRKLTFVVGSDNVEVILDDNGDIAYSKV